MLLTQTKLNARRCLSDWLEQYPELYRKVMQVRYRGSPNYRRIVAPDTDIVIEGFPRCANSFAVRAFRMDNDPEGKLKIATHFHSPAQVRLGVKWKIPTLVLIRHPDEAVVSFPALAIQLNKHGLAKASEAMLRQQVHYWTRRYAQFYERIQPLREHIVVADFSETTKDFGQVIQRINQKYGTHFIPFSHTEERVGEIFSNANKHLSPSAERDGIKERIRELYYKQDNESMRAKVALLYAIYNR